MTNHVNHSILSLNIDRMMTKWQYIHKEILNNDHPIILIQDIPSLASHLALIHQSLDKQGYRTIQHRLDLSIQHQKNFKHLQHYGGPTQFERSDNQNQTQKCIQTNNNYKHLYKT